MRWQMAVHYCACLCQQNADMVIADKGSSGYTQSPVAPVKPVVPEKPVKPVKPVPPAESSTHHPLMILACCIRHEHGTTGFWKEEVCNFAKRFFL